MLFGIARATATASLVRSSWRWLATPRAGNTIHLLPLARRPAQGNFIGIIGNWRSRRLGRGVRDGIRKNAQLPVESPRLPLTVRCYRLHVESITVRWGRRLAGVMVTDTAFSVIGYHHLPSDSIPQRSIGLHGSTRQKPQHASIELSSVPKGSNHLTCSTKWNPGTQSSI